MTATDTKWYVVRTHAQAEARAVMHLQRQGFRAYLPRHRKERRHARRQDVVAAPLFPRYCFVAIDMAYQRWHAIRSTIGVERLIGGKEGPTAVRDEVVNDLMRREGADGLIAIKQRPRFAPGEKVRLVGGVFSLCSALFEGMTDRDRVAVLLDLLGRRVRVVVDETMLTAE